VGELLLSAVEYTRVNDVWQIEIHTAESLLPDPSPLQVKIAIETMIMYK
jgi:hypothetical protein